MQLKLFYRGILILNYSIIILLTDPFHFSMVIPYATDPNHLQASCKRPRKKEKIRHFYSKLPGMTLR